MSKTICSTSRVHTRKNNFEEQLVKVKHEIILNRANHFMRHFCICNYTVDTVFPNKFGETIEIYAERNIKNYTVIIDRLKEMVTVLADPLSDRPIAGEFNWILLAIDHHVEIGDDLFDTMTIKQKKDLLQKLIDESEIRLTMFQSIYISPSVSVLVNPVSSTQESEITMTTITMNDADQASVAINKAADSSEATFKNASQNSNKIDDMLDKAIAAENAMAKEAKKSDAFYSAAEGVKDTTEKVVDAAEKVADKVKEKAEKPVRANKWKIASYVAAATAVVGAGLYLYKKNFNAVNDAVCDAASTVSDVASEQVVGG